jgi:hypothetical protein
MDFNAVEAIATITVTLQNVPVHSRCFIAWKTPTDTGTSNDEAVDPTTHSVVFPPIAVRLDLLGLVGTRFLSLLEVAAWFFDESAAPPSTPLGSVHFNVAENLAIDLAENAWYVLLVICLFINFFFFFFSCCSCLLIG